LIELARLFKQQESELTSNIRFVFFGGEEKGLLGSRAYLNRHKDELDNCNLLFNMDQVGGANIFIETEGGVEGISSEKGMTQFPSYMRNRSLEGITSNWRILAPEAIKIFSVSNRPEWISEIIKQTTDELQIAVSFVGNTGSDQMTFTQAGIVASAIGTSGNKYHSPLDTPLQIKKQSLHDCGSIVAQVVLKTMDRYVSNKNPQNMNFKAGSSIEKNELMTHIRFLASDELKGRKSGTEGAKIAASYISEQFRANNIKVFPSYPDYLQAAYLEKDEQTYEPVLCNNVVGYIEGSDSVLKNEYVLLMAHYDHLGVKKDLNIDEADSIYNGARDNGIGTTALLYSAKVLSKTNLKRSVIFLATTGEEDGMLGSKFFVDNSPVPLENIVFVLNNDGGGFNDTTIIRVGGKNKIDYPFALWDEVEKLGIKSLPYPKELEYLYKLGDSDTFAKLGIPAITISPGFDERYEELLKYVHQPEDEVDNNFNFSYLLKFSRVYQNIAIQIANEKNLPKWKNEK
jgi:Zn-dependent M28 family amino/carboxypeptidase